MGRAALAGERPRTHVAPAYVKLGIVPYRSGDANPTRCAPVVALLLIVVVAACSSSRSSPVSAPTTTVPAAAVQGYTASICGSLRSLRTISRSIEKFMPTLRDDSNSRTLLKARFEALLGAASSATRLGSDFLGGAHLPAGEGVPEHARQVREAMSRSGDEYDRWRQVVAGFDTYDRDNWEDELLTFENGDMTSYGEPAWSRIVQAVMSGPVGAAVMRTVDSAPVCAPIFGA